MDAEPALFNLPKIWADTNKQGRDKDMGVDWGFAGLVSGVGFGVVFGVLVLLAVIIRLVGLVLNKISPIEDATNNKGKGE